MILSGNGRAEVHCEYFGPISGLNLRRDVWEAKFLRVNFRGVHEIGFRSPRTHLKPIPRFALGLDVLNVLKGQGYSI